jgi:hypothetical protein
MINRFIKTILLIFSTIAIFIIVLLFLYFFFPMWYPVEQLSQETNGFIPPDGFVPNKNTAVKIAEAVWLPVYGRKILSQKPYRAKLTDEGIWIVSGTLKGIFTLGGTAYIEIDKQTGTIIKMIHEK